MAVDFIRSIQNFAKANPDIIELDFNPALITNDGLKIVDARIKKEVSQKRKKSLEKIDQTSSKRTSSSYRRVLQTLQKSVTP